MTQNNQEEETHIVALCGSLRAKSYTEMALNVALQGAREFGVTTECICLRDYELIFCAGNEDDSLLTEDVFKLRSKVKSAHGIILGTPEYHGSYSGVLKNALDLMSFDEFEGKMLGLLGVAGGGVGAIDALTGLRTVGRALHAWVLPEQVAIPQVYRVFDADGNCKDEKLEKRILEMGHKVARFAKLHHTDPTIRLDLDAGVE